LKKPLAVHKAQGRTVYPVVLDLSFHPNACNLMFAAIFVAMPQIKGKYLIRILNHSFDISHHDIEKSYSYTTDLRPSPYTVSVNTVQGTSHPRLGALISVLAY